MTRALYAAVLGALVATPLAAAAQAERTPTPVQPASYRAASAADSLRVQPRAEGAAGVLTLDRESFAYVPDGRRDPFRTLMVVGDLRPLVTDLRLSAVFYDGDGESLAVLHDVNTKEQYRVRPGQQLGRMRVAAIRKKAIVFTIEEFGFSRQETLTLGDPTTARTQQ